MILDDIIRMARKSAILDVMDCQYPAVEQALERFTTLVAAALRDEMWEKAMKLVAEAVAAEREACAKVCIAHAQKLEAEGSPAPMARICAAAIRARGQS